MFSGIVEEAARVTGVSRDGGNIELTISCSFADELHIDQSVAHNGVCLTVFFIELRLTIRKLHPSRSNHLGF